MMPAPGLREYFQNTAATITEHPEGFAVITWHAGTRQFDDFKAVLNRLERLLRLRGWSRILADQRQLKPFTEEERHWTVTDWLPRAVGQGPYRHAAVLLPTDVFARLSSQSVLSESQEKFVAYRFCASETEAVEWLRQQ